MVIPACALNARDGCRVGKKQNKPRGCCAGICSSCLPEHLKEKSWDRDKKWQVREKLFSMCHAASSLLVKKKTSVF